MVETVRSSPKITTDAATEPPTKKRAPKKKFCKFQHFLDFLPEGVRYIGPPELFNAQILMHRAKVKNSSPTTAETDDVATVGKLGPDEV